MIHLFFKIGSFFNVLFLRFLAAIPLWKKTYLILIIQISLNFRQILVGYSKWIVILKAVPTLELTKTIPQNTNDSYYD
jgi:hypothetical protein